MTPELVTQIRAIHQPSQCASCAYHVCRVCRDKWPCAGEQRVRSDGYKPWTITAYPLSEEQAKQRAVEAPGR
jgi:hypothetical protein